MRFEKVMHGVMRYLDSEIFASMNDWQEVLARIAVSRVLGNTTELKNKLVNNAYVKTFGIIDSDGNVDVEGLIKDLHQQIDAKGKITITIPMLGTFSFNSADVDTLHRYIMEA